MSQEQHPIIECAVGLMALYSVPSVHKILILSHKVLEPGLKLGYDRNRIIRPEPEPEFRFRLAGTGSRFSNSGSGLKNRNKHIEIPVPV